MCPGVAESTHSDAFRWTQRKPFALRRRFGRFQPCGYSTLTRTSRLRLNAPGHSWGGGAGDRLDEGVALMSRWASLPRDFAQEFDFLGSFDRKALRNQFAERSDEEVDLM